MKIIIKPRRKGKTIELIKLCAEQGGFIVCHNMKERDRILRIAEELELSILCPITYDQLLKREHCLGVDPEIQKVYIDNLDTFITHIVKIPVIAATLTSEKE